MYPCRALFARLFGRYLWVEVISTLAALSALWNGKTTLNLIFLRLRCCFDIRTWSKKMKSISKIPIVAHGIQRKLSKLHSELRNVLCCEQKRRAIIVQVLLVRAVFSCSRILLPFVPKVRMQKRDINGIITGHPKNKHTQYTHTPYTGYKEKSF